MDDLRRILAGRAAFYAKADVDARHQRGSRCEADASPALRERCAGDCGRPSMKQTACTLDLQTSMHYDASCLQRCTHLHVADRMRPITPRPRVDYRTDPSQLPPLEARVRRPGRHADARRRRGRRHPPRLQAQAQQLRPRRRHRAARRAATASASSIPKCARSSSPARKDRIFCSGANIFMLGLSQPRLEGELLQVHQRDAQRHRGLVAALRAQVPRRASTAPAPAAATSWRWPATRSSWSTTARRRSACPRCRCSACCPAPAA